MEKAAKGRVDILFRYLPLYSYLSKKLQSKERLKRG